MQILLPTEAQIQAAQIVYESDEGQKYRKLIMQKIDEAIGETAKEVKK